MKALHFTKAQENALVAAARLPDPVITDPAIGDALAGMNLVYPDGAVYRFHTHGLALAVAMRIAFDLRATDF